MGEKTEKATPKKLNDARKKGQVAKSQDFPAAFTFMVSVSTVLHSAGSIFEQFSGLIIGLFTSMNGNDIQSLLPNLFRQAFATILTVSLPILGLTVISGVIVNFLIIGPVFSVEVFKPDLKKLDPIKGLQNKFKLKTFVELIKSMIKLIGAAYLIYTVVFDLLPLIINAPKVDILHDVEIISVFLKKSILKVGIFFVAIAIFDLVYQKANFAKEMMMEKFDIKQEYKNMEGDPQIKGKRKEIAREIAYSAGSAAGVYLSKAVITNPVHLAVAIAYEENEHAAPIVMAKGKNYEANLITTEAKYHDIPILRNISLAHDLFEKSTVFDYIPEETFEPVAEILKWLASLEQNNKGE